MRIAYFQPPERNMQAQVERKRDRGCDQQASGQSSQAIDRIAARADFLEEPVQEDVE